VNKNIFSFSAKKLQDYLDCERRYELKYILNQSWPAVACEPILEIESNIKKGNEFHFLIHQYFSGIPSGILLDTIHDNSMKKWFANFLLFQESLKAVTCFSEFSLSAQIRENKLTAIYDLIFLNEDQDVWIIDWKTSHAKPKKSALTSKIQSILYPFILNEVLDEIFPKMNISPEKISMRYWYPSSPNEDVIFPYGQSVHQENRVFLENVINEIQGKETGEYKLTKDEKKCRFCPYRSLCKHGITTSNLLELEENNLDESDLSTMYDQLPEISFDL